MLSSSRVTASRAASITEGSTCSSGTAIRIRIESSYGNARERGVRACKRREQRGRGQARPSRGNLHKGGARAPSPPLVQVMAEGADRVHLEVGAGRKRGERRLAPNPNPGFRLFEAEPGIERGSRADRFEVDEP